MNSETDERPEGLKAALEEAEAVYSEGDLERALEMFEQIAHDHPDDPVSVFSVGVILDKQGQMEAAIKRTQEALRRDPGFAKAKLNLAAMYYEMGDLVTAAVVLKEALSKGVPHWIGERMLRLRQLLEDAALERLAVRTSKAEGGLVIGTGIEEVGRCVGALLGREVAHCDMAVTTAGNVYTMKAGDDYLRARVEGSELVVRLDPTGEEVLRRELPIWEPEPEEAEEEAHPDWVEAEIDFGTSDAGIKEFLQYIQDMCEALEREPDKLYYVLHGMDAGEWEDPVRFEHADWEQAFEEVDGAWFGWQIDCFLRTPEYEIEGHANPAFWAKIYAVGDRSLIDTLTDLRERQKDKRG